MGNEGREYPLPRLQDVAILPELQWGPSQVTGQRVQILEMYWEAYLQDRARD